MTLVVRSPFGRISGAVFRRSISVSGCLDPGMPDTAVRSRAGKQDDEKPQGRRGPALGAQLPGEGYVAAISILWPFALAISVFGMWIFSTPFFISATIFVTSTVFGRMKVRRNAP